MQNVAAGADGRDGADASDPRQSAPKSPGDRERAELLDDLAEGQIAGHLAKVFTRRLMASNCVAQVKAGS
jgi:hypothetical protein